MRSRTLIPLALCAAIAMAGAGVASGARTPVVTITCTKNAVTVVPSQVRYGTYSVVYVNRSTMTARFAFQGKRGSGSLRPGQRVARSMTFDRYTKPLGNSIDRSATPMVSCELGRNAPELGPGGYEWSTVAGQSLVVCAATPCHPDTYALQERPDRAVPPVTAP
jgi:hypothetical protein